MVLEGELLLAEFLNNILVGIPARIDESVEALLKHIEVLLDLLDLRETTEKVLLEITDQDPAGVVLSKLQQDFLRLLEVDGLAKDFQHFPQVIRLYLVLRALLEVKVLI